MGTRSPDPFSLMQRSLVWLHVLQGECLNHQKYCTHLACRMQRFQQINSSILHNKHAGNQQRFLPRSNNLLQDYTLANQQECSFVRSDIFRMPEYTLAWWYETPPTSYGHAYLSHCSSVGQARPNMAMSLWQSACTVLHSARQGAITVLGSVQAGTKA